MAHIAKLSIKNYRGIRDLTQDFDSEKFIVLIGRGDSGKSTILSAIYAVLSPSWNLSFSDLDFYNQDTSQPIEIEVEIRELPQELLTEKRCGLYVQNDLDRKEVEESEIFIIVRLCVDETLEPHWVVKARTDSGIEDKPLSSAERAMLSVNYITDYSDNQFAYNRQSPLYALTKASLADGNTIEHVKSALIRSMSKSVDKELLEPLNAPMESLKKTAKKLGLNVTDLCAQMDIKENPYTGNSIALHHDSVPYRLNGKGSKRLMSIAIQSELTRQGGIVLIDEIEQGLEPDRIITLVRLLKATSSGQVFITTHSINVLIEVSWRNIYITRKEEQYLLSIGEDLEACRRTQPQAFYAKKIICCEGKTEVGFLRSIDSWLSQNRFTTFSANGAVVIDSNGGANMYNYAIKLKQLGYDTLIWGDDDNSEELSRHKQRAIDEDIPTILCQQGNCLERQLFMDLPWESFTEILRCPQKDFPKHCINVTEESLLALETNSSEEQGRLREEYTKKATEEKWFKHIPGGEFLGNVTMRAYDSLSDESTTKMNIQSLLKWLNV